MTSTAPDAKSLFEVSLVIDVIHKPGRWFWSRGKTYFEKPHDALNGHLYSIRSEAGATVVDVNWEDGLQRLVRSIEFRVNYEVVAVGFSECACGIEPYSRTGPCGGNFWLRTDLSSGTEKTVLIDNWGHSRKNGAPYHFALWLRHELGEGRGWRARRIEVDPQIYNQGQLPPGNPGCLGRLF